MSGSSVQSTGGLSFTPRIRKRPESKHTAAPLSPDNHFAVPAEKSEPAGPLTTASPLSSTSLERVNGHTTALPLRSTGDWTNLPDSQLWHYYVKIRTLYFSQGGSSKLDVHSPLSQRYLAIRKFLFHKYLPDVLRTAASYKRKRMPQSSLTDPEDLEQVAAMAMLLLLDKYDPAFGDGQVKFMGYANAQASRIQGAMTDALRRFQGFPRSIPPLRRKYKAVFQGIQAELGYQPTKEEILDQIGWEKRNRKMICDSLLEAGIFNQSQVSSEGSDSEAWEAEIIQLCEARPELKERRLIKRENMNKILAVLSDKPEIRFIIFSYYFCNATFERVAKELRKAYGKRRSSSWVHVKHEEGLAILERHFTREEFKEMTRE